MPRPRSLQSVYKDISYSQLRSFCETARLGSMAAAARSLNLSHPTIWKQIRVLEEQVRQPLLEVAGGRRGLTDAGRTLAHLASTVVAEFETLQHRFREACDAAPRRLAISASPRICAEDLPPVVDAFHRQHPQIRPSIREAVLDVSMQLVHSGEVDLVLATSQHAHKSGNLVTELCYELEPILVMSPKHPLSRVRQIRVKDLAEFPLLNQRGGYPDPEVNAALEKIRAFDHPDRRFELAGAATICACARQGHGIGLTSRTAKRPPFPGLRERSLKHLFPSLVCYAYTSRRVSMHDAGALFIQAVKSVLYVPSKNRPSRRLASRSRSSS